MSKGKKVKLNLNPLWSSNYLILHELVKATGKFIIKKIKLTEFSK